MNLKILFRICFLIKKLMAASQGMLFALARYLILMLIPNPTLSKSKVEIKLYYYTIAKATNSAVSRCGG